MTLEREEFFRRRQRSAWAALPLSELLFTIFREHIRLGVRFAGLRRGDNCFTVHYSSGRSLAEFFRARGVQNSLVEWANEDCSDIRDRAVSLKEEFSESLLSNRLEAEVIAGVLNMQKLERSALDESMLSEFCASLRAAVSHALRSQHGLPNALKHGLGAAALLASALGVLRVTGGWLIDEAISDPSGALYAAFSEAPLGDDTLARTGAIPMLVLVLSGLSVWVYHARR